LRSLRTGTAGLLAALALVAAIPAPSVEAGPVSGPPAIAAKSCGAGYTHAVMPDRAHKCLRAGQFCSHRPGWQTTYHRYGFHCKRSGHLTDY